MKLPGIGNESGNLGMFAAIRDERIQCVVSLAGPDTYLVESYKNQPNFKPSYDNWFLKALTSAESSVNVARARVVALSSIAKAPHSNSLIPHAPTLIILRRAVQGSVLG